MSMVGKTLGAFECTALIGKGGMGEVYRAKDQKLGRDVAIKVLPEEFAKDADRVARFQREAKLLASLNHPNIAAIHGLEESDGTHFLVLELIEGDTLADRLKHGAIPVEEALKLALQIAEALEAAHEKGVIHRDLKPANIKVTPDGKVKVLDFGLAKAFAGEQAEINLSHSPTLSEAATLQGVILGTAAYMSPEQARGKPVDKRTDIWAFGCVLYEMLTGKAAFQGEDVTEILAAVVKSGVNLDLLPVNINPRVREAIVRCLQKDLKDRYRDIGDAQFEIKQVLADPSEIFVQPVTAAKPRKKMRVGIPWIAATLVLGAIIAGVAVWILRPTEPKRVVSFIHQLSEGQQFVRNVVGEIDAVAAVSPDGSQFAYATTEGLYLRSIKEFEAKLIAGTDKDSKYPFFSPDGQSIGYFSGSDQKLKKMAVSGGAPVALCDVGPAILGVSWDSEDTILFSDFTGGGIMRVPSKGGSPELLIKGGIGNLEKGFPAYPQLLPDGKSLLFTSMLELNIAGMQIVVQSLESGERKVLVERGMGAKYLPTGHIVYVSANNDINNLYAVPFDLEKLELAGDPISIVEGVQGFPAFSDSGVIAYAPQSTTMTGADGAIGSNETLVWVNREGKEEPLTAEPNVYDFFKISPDGRKVALSIGRSSFRDVWIWDLDREIKNKLTFMDGADYVPLWTPDSQRIIYTSAGGTGITNSILWKKADGTGEAEKLYSGEDEVIFPFSISGDGKVLMLWILNLTPTLQNNIATFSMDEDQTRTPLLHEDYNELYPQISPDDQWIAFESDKTGRTEVYVQPFPEVNLGIWQVSTNGGDSPLWSPDGRELFYRNGNSFMAVEIEIDPAFSSGKPRVLFKGTYVTSHDGARCVLWDIHPDGKRFLMVKPPGEIADDSGAIAPPKINIVLNWFEELKERVPVD